MIRVQHSIRVQRSRNHLGAAGGQFQLFADNEAPSPTAYVEASTQLGQYELVRQRWTVKSHGYDG